LSPLPTQRILHEMATFSGAGVQPGVEEPLAASVQPAMTKAAVLMVCGALLGAGGCDGSCPRRLIIRSQYTGTVTGVHYSRDISPHGTVIGATKSELHTGPVPQAKVDDGCYEQTAPADEPGWHRQYWIDTNDDDAASCLFTGGPGTGIYDLKACGPDPGEPQLDQPYTIRASGVTEVSVVLSD
jgi:hypothetical protein